MVFHRAFASSTRQPWHGWDCIPALAAQLVIKCPDRIDVEQTAKVAYPSWEVTLHEEGTADVRQLLAATLYESFLLARWVMSNLSSVIKNRSRVGN
jgi:hypothetical protein